MRQPSRSTSAHGPARSLGARSAPYSSASTGSWVAAIRLRGVMPQDVGGGGDHGRSPDPVFPVCDRDRTRSCRSASARTFASRTVQLADIPRRDRCVSPEIERPCEWDLLTGDPCDEPAVRSFNVGGDWPERSYPGSLETFWLCEKHCTEATAIRDGKE